MSEPMPGTPEHRRMIDGVLNTGTLLPGQENRYVNPEWVLVLPYVVFGTIAMACSLITGAVAPIMAVALLVAALTEVALLVTRRTYTHAAIFEHMCLRVVIITVLIGVCGVIDGDAHVHDKLNFLTDRMRSA